MGNRLSVTIITSLAGEEAVAAPPAVARPKAAKTRSSSGPSVKPQPIEKPQPEPAAVEEPPVFEPEPQPEPELEPVPQAEAEPELEPEPDLERVEEDEEESALIPFEQPDAELAPPPPPPPPPKVIPIEPQAKPHIVRPDPQQPRLIVPKKKPLIQKEAKPEKVQAKQEMMQFEPLNRGRFEKSEPTIVEGQDLDVPTFLRKNIRVK